MTQVWFSVTVQVTQVWFSVNVQNEGLDGLAHAVEEPAHGHPGGADRSQCQGDQL